MSYKSKNMKLGGKNDIDNDLFLDYIRLIDTNAINAIDEHNVDKLFTHKDVFPSPFQTRALKPYQRLYIPFTQRLFGNDAVNFQFNVPGTDYSFSEGKVAEYFPAQPAKMFVYLLNKQKSQELKQIITSGNKQLELALRNEANAIYNQAVNERNNSKNPDRNAVQQQFVNRISSHWSLHEIDHADWVSLLKNKSVLPHIKLKSLVPKLEYVQIWNNFAPCSGPNGTRRSKPECLYIGSQNHTEKAPGQVDVSPNQPARGCVWLGKSQGCKECKSLKTVEECGKFPVQCAYNKIANECIPRTLQDQYNEQYGIPAEYHISTPMERKINSMQRSTRHVHTAPDGRLLVHEHPNTGPHRGHSALQEMQARLNKGSEQMNWSYGHLDKTRSYLNTVPSNKSPSAISINEELAKDPKVEQIMNTQRLLNAIGGKKKSRKSRKSRKSNKKRVSKRKVSKKRVSKKRVSRKKRN